MDSNEQYKLARTVTEALNRLRKPTARRRSHEKKSHFNRDIKKARALWHDDNILGYGVGPKVSEGGKSDFCLVFFVRKKMAKSRIRELTEIPRRLMLETLGVEIQTDVQEWGRPPVAHSTLAPGGQIGDSFGHAGTITARVRDASSGLPLMLSCSHVLARGGEEASQGDLIESPVVPFAALGTNVVGRLSRFTVLSRNASDNDVDAAVAEPDPGVKLSNQLGDSVSISGIRDLTDDTIETADSLNNLRLQKIGNVSHSLTGTLGNMHIATSIIYHEMSGDPILDFVELAELDCLSEEGDSGAPILDMQNRIVGMNIAGQADGSCLFIHIQKIFDRLMIAL